MANDHTIYVRGGHVGTVAEANKNGSVAQSNLSSPTQSPIGTALKAGTFILAGKTIMNAVTSNIGYATGDYELQEKIETAFTIGGVVTGLVVAPLPTIIAGSVKVGTDLWKLNKVHTRQAFEQRQAQIFTGAVSVNSSRW